MFMDNEFFLPTGAGFPLRVALSGTFTPGVKGGLRFNPGKVSPTHFSHAQVIVNNRLSGISTIMLEDVFMFFKKLHLFDQK